MSVYAWSGSLKNHRQCAGDTFRIKAHAQAFSEILNQGDVVVEVGTGSGILAIMACRAGASRVYAIEPDQIIESAKQVAFDNGLAEQITFLPGLSYDVEIPERADVFLAGHLHNFGLETGLLSSIIDARKRYLKPNAALIPQSIELHIVPVEVAEKYGEIIEFWMSVPAGIDYGSVRELAVDSCHMIELQPSSFLSEPGSLMRLNLPELENTFVSGQASFTVGRKGVLHGIGGWCSAQLSPSVTFSNNPSSPSANWSQIFFPIAKPCDVYPGDQVSCSIDTNDGHVWRWRVEVRKAEPTVDSGSSALHFDHSTFHPTLISKETLNKSSAAFKPHLSKRGRALLHTLQLSNGEKSRLEIEEEIAAKFGDYFGSRELIASFVTSELQRWWARKDEG